MREDVEGFHERRLSKEDIARELKHIKRLIELTNL